MDILMLAADFAQEVRDALTQEQCALAVARNATPEYASACATHDFCDANMLMLAAMENQGADFDGDDQTQVDAINAAWDKARSSGFDAEALAREFYGKQKGEAIIEQLGGRGQLAAMIGVREFEFTEQGVAFDVGNIRNKDGIDRIEIAHTPSDYYDVSYFKTVGGQRQLASKSQEIDASQLAESIRTHTALEIRMPKLARGSGLIF